MNTLVSENGKIDKDGRLKIYNRDHFLTRCMGFPECNIEVKIIERSSGFTDQQRKYYFTVVIPSLRNAFRYYGYEYTMKEVDDLMRDKGLFKEHWDTEKKEWVRENHRLSNDDSEVSFSEFKEYLEYCIRFAAEKLNWSIAFPNELLQRDDLTDQQINFHINRK